MLKNKTKFIAFFLVLFLLFSSTFVFADDEVSQDNEIMPISDESVENAVENTKTQEDSYKKSDVYLTGDNITIDYIVDGNLFVVADTVTINSQIGGDAFICAKNVIINKDGYVFSNLFTTAESVEIKGVVYDVFALAKNFTISGGFVYRDLKVACDNLTINGSVGRNAFVACSSINFNTDQNSNGIIYGDLNYSSDPEVSIPENSVKGNVNYTNLDSSSEQKTVASIIAAYIVNLGKFLAFVLIIWLICLALAPKFLANTNNYVGKKTLGIFGYGLLSLIVVPIACIILVLLRLTSGFSLFLMTLYILAIVVSKSLFTITANNYVCSKMKINKNLGIFGMLIVTGIITFVLTQLPFVGPIISFIISILGLGILVVSILPKKINKKDEEKKEIVIEEEKTDK